MQFIVLQSSIGKFRKSKKVSAFNFDSEGVKKAIPCDPGPEAHPNRDKYF